MDFGQDSTPSSLLFLLFASETQIRVSEVFASGDANIRTLSPAKTSSWEALCILVEPVLLRTSQDSIRWDLEDSGIFSDKSVYAKLVPGTEVRFAKSLWATRVPLKFRIFIWQEAMDHLLLALNLKKCNGPGNGCCALCGSSKDVHHILFQCAPVKFLWSSIWECLGLC